MKNLSFKGFKRINKTVAKRLYNAGNIIRICAANVSPTNMYGAYSDISIDGMNIVNSGFNTTVARNNDFETVVNAFKYYNCRRALGYYPAFYIKEVN